VAGKDDSEEKTHKPTAKRLREARKNGQVAQSKELTGAAGLLCGVVAIAFAMPTILGYFEQLLSLSVTATSGISQGAVKTALMHAFMVLALVALPVLFVCGFFASIVARIQTGSVFSLEPVKPKLERVNPMQLIKQIFSAKSIVMLLMMVGKTALMAVGIFVVFNHFMSDAIQMVIGGAPAALTVVREANVALVIWCVVAFLGMAGLDFAFQRYQFGRDMRMSLHDIKRERREDEGDPIIKSARRNASREANLVDQMQYVEHASLVLNDDLGRTIALAYVPDQYVKPIVIVRAAGGLGQFVIKTAQDNAVPVISQIKLVNRLWPVSTNSATVPDGFEEELIALIKYHRGDA